MKITKDKVDALRKDMLAVMTHYGLDFAHQDHGKTGLKFMHALHTIVSQQRAYDDSHPMFASGKWPRILPYDGRDYCWLYEGGCDDTHVATALRHIKDQFTTLQHS